MGTTVPKDYPIGPIRKNLRSRFPFVVAVVPLHQVLIDFRYRIVTREFAGARRALKGAVKYTRKADPFQSAAERFRLFLSRQGQREIR